MLEIFSYNSCFFKKGIIITEENIELTLSVRLPDATLI